jgi:hypothetical protein
MVARHEDLKTILDCVQVQVGTRLITLARFAKVDAFGSTPDTVGTLQICPESGGYLNFLAIQHNQDSFTKAAILGYTRSRSDQRKHFGNPILLRIVRPDDALHGSHTEQCLKIGTPSTGSISASPHLTHV